MKSSDEAGTSPLTPAVFHILLALAEGKQHGYAIMNAVEESSGPQAIRMGPGTIYGSLQRMAGAGLVEEVEGERGGRGRPRRTFALTAEGRRALHEESARITRLAGLVRDRNLLPKGASSK